MSLFSRMSSSINRGAAIVTAVLIVLLAAPALVPGASAAQAVTNGRIAFQSERPPGDLSHADIYTMDQDGSNVAGPVSNPSFDSSDPAFSPDGTKIAFSSFEFSGNPCCQSIAVMNADGSDRHLVVNGDTTLSGINQEPSWSPDGTQLAFLVHLNGANQIAKVNADGTGFTPLTSFTSGDQLYPAWSPDGSKIAYESNRSSAFKIYVMNADGTNDTLLTTPGGALDPAWSPDGSKIAFADFSDGGPEISVIDANGANPVQLTHDDMDRQPAWSPDGAKLAFVSTRDGNQEIYTMNADGSAPTRITNNPANDSWPSWQSVPSVDVVVTDCGDPGLAQLTEVTGNLVVENLPDCKAVSLPNLATVGGAVNINQNPAVTTVDLSSLTTASGSVDVSQNTSATTVDLSSLATVGGNLTVETAGSAVDLSGASVAGDLTLTANGADSVSANTAGGTTDVSVLGGTASMHVVLPDGAFDQPVMFSIERQADIPAEPGTAADGSPAMIDPVVSYRFAFAVPTLNKDAQLTFTIDLAALDEATRAALLAGVGDGSATIVVKGDDPGAVYQAFARCVQGQTPETNGCVDAVLLGADGQPAPSGTDPAFVRFTGIAGHFSIYAVALVSPITPSDCVGDCNGTRTVAVSDLVTLVNIALGSAAPLACSHGIPAGTTVDVSLVVRAVNNALHGCP